jgi:hypothetical protein
VSNIESFQKSTTDFGSFLRNLSRKIKQEFCLWVMYFSISSVFSEDISLYQSDIMTCFEMKTSLGAPPH